MLGLPGSNAYPSRAIRIELSAVIFAIVPNSQRTEEGCAVSRKTNTIWGPGGRRKMAIGGTVTALAAIILSFRLGWGEAVENAFEAHVRIASRAFSSRPMSSLLSEGMKNRLSIFKRPPQVQ